jgi:Protein  of unknown function (DUF3018)
MAGRLSKTERVRRHRERLRAQGLRPIQLWVPDTRDPKFVEEVRRQSLLVRDSASEREINDWLEAAQADLWASEDEWKD